MYVYSGLTAPSKVCAILTGKKVVTLAGGRRYYPLKMEDNLILLIEMTLIFWKMEDNLIFSMDDDLNFLNQRRPKLF